MDENEYLIGYCHMQQKLIAFIVFGFSSSVSCEIFTAAMFKAVQENDEEAVLIAILQGAHVNSRDGKNWTALHHAAEIGNAKIIQILVEHNADKELVDDNYMTPFLIAVAAGNGMEVLKLIELKANVHAINRHKQNALELARIYQHDEVVKILEDLRKPMESKDTDSVEESKTIERESVSGPQTVSKKTSARPRNRGAYLMLGMAVGVFAGMKLAQPRN